MGISSAVSRSTLADANETRAIICNWRIHADFAQSLIAVALKLYAAALSYPHKLRRVAFRDLETGKRLSVLTNNFDLPALTLAKLYRCRWQVELFFKWIKQHLRIKAFSGTSENAVKTQIWIAISVYVIVAIVKKRMKLPASLYEILQILSLTIFERIPLDQLLAKSVEDEIADNSRNQLDLFE